MKGIQDTASLKIVEHNFICLYLMPDDIQGVCALEGFGENLVWEFTIVSQHH